MNARIMSGTNDDQARRCDFFFVALFAVHVVIVYSRDTLFRMRGSALFLVSESSILPLNPATEFRYQISMIMIFILKRQQREKETETRRKNDKLLHSSDALYNEKSEYPALLLRMRSALRCHLSFVYRAARRVEFETRVQNRWHPTATTTPCSFFLVSPFLTAGATSMSIRNGSPQQKCWLLSYSVHCSRTFA